jgi:hypothetical protein
MTAAADGRSSGYDWRRVKKNAVDVNKSSE